MGKQEHSKMQTRAAARKLDRVPTLSLTSSVTTGHVPLRFKGSTYKTLGLADDARGPALLTMLII